jgi:hypothetical protein
MTTHSYANVPRAARRPRHRRPFPFRVIGVTARMVLRGMAIGVFAGALLLGFGALARVDRGPAGQPSDPALVVTTWHR